jgi:hypothetical protein
MPLQTQALGIFLDMVAVALGLAVIGLVLGALALAAFYVLGMVRDAQGREALRKS